MASNTNKAPTKRLPKGKRIYIRKMKSEANRAGTVYKPAI